MDWLDPYELRARAAPTLVVTLPGIVTFIFLVFSTSESIVQLISSGVVFLVMIYALSFLVRYLGKKVEPKIWDAWDGPPSTRFMRWCNSHFGEENKHALHEAVGSVCRIELSLPGDEAGAPREADRRISEAFEQVKATVRLQNPDGVWTKHNAEYGFHRNLLGSRILWALSAVASALICGTVWYADGSQLFLIAAAINTVIFACSVVCGWFLLPRFTREAADRYADSVWNAFLAGTRPSQ